MRQFALLVASMTLLALPLSASATVGEKIDSAGRAASSALNKTQNAVVRGVKAAASGVERGAHAAGRAADKGAKKVGVPGAGESAPKR